MSGIYADYYTVSPIRSPGNAVDGYLFGNGTDPVELSSDALPPWFVPARIFGIDGFASARDAASVSYRPSFSSPGHLFRDDSLSVIYRRRDGSGRKGTRIVIWGASIIPFLRLASIHSPECDLSEAMELLQRKMDYLASFTSSGEAP